MTLADLRSKLASLGATLDEQADAFIVCDAPRGYVWRGTGGTSLTITYRNGGGQSWLAKAIRDELPSLRLGLDRVTSPEELDEIRHLLDDDNWGAPEGAPERIEWPKGTR